MPARGAATHAEKCSTYKRSRLYMAEAARYGRLHRVSLEQRSVCVPNQFHKEGWANMMDPQLLKLSLLARWSWCCSVAMSDSQPRLLRHKEPFRSKPLANQPSDGMMQCLYIKLAKYL